MRDEIRSILTHARARDLQEMRECGFDIQSTVTAERIARLETQVNVLADNTRELKGSINELVHELRRK